MCAGSVTPIGRNDLNICMHDVAVVQVAGSNRSGSSHLPHDKLRHFSF